MSEYKTRDMKLRLWGISGVYCPGILDCGRGSVQGKEIEFCKI